MVGIAIAIAVVLVLLVLLFNSLVSKKNRVLNAFAGIDVLLKKRNDLIPNLIASVKQYMQHEQGVLTRITEIRTRALEGGLSDDAKVEIDNEMVGALRGLMVAVENYPQLKANENFLQLQAALNEVEEQISAARRNYNATVLEYNNALEMIPTNMIAAMMQYRTKMFFEATEKERAVVDVKSGFES